MRVFVTGATGFIGSAVVPELLGAGHQVLGLARSEASAAALVAVGAEVHRGTLQDHDSLRAGAAAADGVVHLAYVHDFADFAGGFEANALTDLRAIEAIGAELAGTGKPLVITSGTLMLTAIAPGRLGTEEITAPGSTAPRIASENAAVALAGRGVRTSVVRLAPTVHGEGDKGFVPQLIGAARASGVSPFVGDGTNRWPAVHRLDAARLYRLALESASPGSILHGAGEEGVPFREIAAAIGRRLDLPVVPLAAADAPAHFGFLAAFASLDNPTSSALTQKQLSWQPAHPDLIPDLDAGHYFG